MSKDRTILTVAHAFIHERNEPHLPLLTHPKLDPGLIEG